MKPLIGICSQDAEFYLVLSHILAVDGFASVLASNADEMVDLALTAQTQAWVLDCRPDTPMAAGCARLKQDAATSTVPVIAMIAPGAESHHVELLKAGIDESLVRPAAPAKLLDYLSRRLGTGRKPSFAPEGGTLLSYSGIDMDLDTHRVQCHGQDIVLGPIEFKLLRYMLEHPDKVLSRDALIRAAWPTNVYVGERTVDVHISRLRKSLHPMQGDVIRTIRLAGYALEGPPVAEEV